MKQLSFLTLCLLQVTSLLAQQKFIVHGTVEMLTKSKNIYVDNFSAPINADGTFEISGGMSGTHEAMIHTDSSSISFIWLTNGDYNISCKELTVPDAKSVLFQIADLTGPQSAEIYTAFFKNLHNKATATKFMDSVFKNYLKDIPLPSIIIDAHQVVGYDETMKYISMLSDEQKNKSNMGFWETVFTRQEKIDKDNECFESFSMKTADGKDFQLSQLVNKKAVLLDFWATGCAPCRAEHPKLIDWYKKYADKGLAIVCISLDNDKDEWLKSIAQDKIERLINVSELKDWQTSLVKDYSINFIPFRFLLDGSRNVVKVYDISNLSEKDITDALNK